MDGMSSDRILFGPVFVGLGCRRGCGWEEIAALVAGAFDEAALPDAARRLAALAAPAMKSDEPGLAEAARALGLPLRFIEEDAMLAAQDRVHTRSATVLAAVGLASVAEAAALAAAGPGSRLLLPRRSTPRATVALALPAVALPGVTLPETRT
ncbi:cobalamin biosynthesis protein [Azospirillum sp. HJ39]|uniref:cobalamin biosynthesis protein n=1 Tax=Azospirillum sp. HJ39 TaxID=3159496 RepID=UPI003558C3D7